MWNLHFDFLVSRFFFCCHFIFAAHMNFLVQFINKTLQIWNTKKIEKILNRFWQNCHVRRKFQTKSLYWKLCLNAHVSHLNWDNMFGNQFGSNFEMIIFGISQPKTPIKLSKSATQIKLLSQNTIRHRLFQSLVTFQLSSPKAIQSEAKFMYFTFFTFFFLFI